MILEKTDQFPVMSVSNMMKVSQIKESCCCATTVTAEGGMPELCIDIVHDKECMGVCLIKQLNKAFMNII